MAGVYIKDAKLPDACWNCGWDPCMLWNEDRGDLPKHPNCPLVEVPDHGDLIDRETIVDSVCNGVCSCSECSFNRYPSDSCVLQTNLEKLKVVIPADKDGV